MIKLTKLPLPCPENRRLMPARRRTKSGRSYDGLIVSPEARQKRARMRYAIWDQLGGRPEPMVGPVMMTGRFWYAYKSKVPDVDAYTKETMDVLTWAGIWKDDTQLIQAPPFERMGPMWPGYIDLEIWEVEND